MFMSNGNPRRDQWSEVNLHCIHNRKHLTNPPSFHLLPSFTTEERCPYQIVQNLVDCHQQNDAQSYVQHPIRPGTSTELARTFPFIGVILISMTPPNTPRNKH